MTKIIWEAKKTPFAGLTCTMLTALWLQPALREVPWEHCCWNYGEEGLHSLIFPDRIQSSLSKGEKELCWAHPRTRGPYGCTEDRRVCRQHCLGRGSRTGRVVTPHSPPQSLASPTEKQKQQKKKEEEIYTNFLRCCSREAQADQGLSPSLLFLYVKWKKKFKEVQPWSTGSKHHSLDLRQMAERKVLNRACFRCADVLGSWKRAVSWQNDMGSWGYKLGEGLAM